VIGDSDDIEFTRAGDVIQDILHRVDAIADVGVHVQIRAPDSLLGHVSRTSRFMMVIRFRINFSSSCHAASTKFRSFWCGEKHSSASL
jgi:hypothetical protein